MEQGTHKPLVVSSNLTLATPFYKNLPAGRFLHYVSTQKQKFIEVNFLSSPRGFMRTKFLVAVHLFFLKDNQILISRRFNTGYEDGKYSVVAGHVDSGETVTQAAIREAKEEVGVSLTPANLEVIHVMNRKSDDERIDFFMTVNNWIGEITNTEPNKCDDLRWVKFNALPANTIPYVRRAIELYQANITYSEFGWN